MSTATAEVIYAASGTGFSVNVTACNLTTDLTIKDFVVILEDNSFDDLADWAKTSSSTLDYTGPALSETISIRRKTPADQLKTAAYAERVISQDWNSEVDRLYRNLVEYETFGTDYLNSTPGGTGEIRDGAYGVSWDGDTQNSASRNAIYDQLELDRADIATNTADIATNTGDISTNAGNIATNSIDIGTNASDIVTNTADIATNTADIASNLAAIQDIQNGYTFSGNIQAPGVTATVSMTTVSPTLATDNTTVPTTAWVRDQFYVASNRTTSLGFITNVTNIGGVWRASYAHKIGLDYVLISIAVTNGTGGALASGTAIMTLPVGYRPAVGSEFVTGYGTNQAMVLIFDTGGVGRIYRRDGGTWDNGSFAVFKGLISLN